MDNPYQPPREGRATKKVKDPPSQSAILRAGILGSVIAFAGALLFGVLWAQLDPSALPGIPYFVFVGTPSGFAAGAILFAIFGWTYRNEGSENRLRLEEKDPPSCSAVMLSGVAGSGLGFLVAILYGAVLVHQNDDPTIGGAVYALAMLGMTVGFAAGAILWTLFGWKRRK